MTVFPPSFNVKIENSLSTVKWPLGLKSNQSCQKLFYLFLNFLVATFAVCVNSENFIPRTNIILCFMLKSVLKRGLTSSIQITVQASAKHIEVDLSESDIRGYATEVALLIIKETHNALTKQPPLQHNLENAKGAVCVHRFHPEPEEILKVSKANAQTGFCSDCFPPGRKIIQECSTPNSKVLRKFQGSV